MINILSSKKYEYLKRRMLEQSRCFKDLAIETKTFPDGEHYITGKLPILKNCATDRLFI